MSITPLLAGQRTCSRTEPAIRALSRVKMIGYAEIARVLTTLTRFGCVKN
jgi:hypothetical protein